MNTLKAFYSLLRQSEIIDDTHNMLHSRRANIFEKFVALVMMVILFIPVVTLFGVLPAFLEYLLKGAVRFTRNGLRSLSRVLTLLFRTNH